MKRRRLLVACLLVMVLALVLLGQTVLAGRLSPLGTLLFWGGGLLLTAFAILLALVDALRTLGEGRREQQALLKETLGEIEKEASHPEAEGRDPTR
jgi:hypothetical protein